VDAAPGSRRSPTRTGAAVGAARARVHDHAAAAGGGRRRSSAAAWRRRRGDAERWARFARATAHRRVLLGVPRRRPRAVASADIQAVRRPAGAAAGVAAGVPRGAASCRCSVSGDAGAGAVAARRPSRPRSAPAVRRALRPAARAIASRPAVLVAEDNPINQQVITLMLEGWGAA
jgi:hypothetical protein